MVCPLHPGTDHTRGEAPKKCSTFLGGFSHKIIITSTTPIVTPEFSSDLERAPGARSIADENSGVTFGVVELRRCEAYEHFRSHPVLLGTLQYPEPSWVPLSLAQRLGEHHFGAPKRKKERKHTHNPHCPPVSRITRVGGVARDSTHTASSVQTCFLETVLPSRGMYLV